MNRFYSHGKLLLTGEYVVLDGVLSLAIPSKYGQSLEITSNQGADLVWKSIDHQKTLWYESNFQIAHNKILNDQNDTVSKRLVDILTVVEDLNPGFLNSISGSQIETRMEFPNDWGLGSSSTLINNIAIWAGIDPYRLLKNTFGGSGYDIACANSEAPLTYQLKQNKSNRSIHQVTFDPVFKDQLFFVHLNQKQDSRQGIAQYMKHRSNVESVVNEISEITASLIACTQLEDFQKLINKHETIISKITNQTPVKECQFSDFNGEIKSLGAWGGDFILAASIDDPRSYFNSKGFPTILKYDDMVL